ncbi:MAG: iron-containing alcohol dehydrogenase [Lachnospiraceae bacterium]|jgi:alcohol dehydrogenase YqhD (iron-dependent ADH family)|nr:iron-containing alcohol dehydrogenase [Lachnospiraceae bacterium]
MNNFQYFTPTKVIFGKDTESQAGDLVKEQKGTKVLVHYGTGSVKRSGLLDRVYASLDKAGIPYVSLGGVVPNPRLSMVYKGIELCKKEDVDFILAVGGGSAIDSAKAIAYGLKYDGDVWDLYLKKEVPQDAMPLGVILTIAATGSEMSNSSVITNEEGWLKRGLNHDISRPRFAIMNPELTYTLPEYQTMSGCTDIMMHTMERYFSHEMDTDLTDYLAEGLLKSVMHAAKVLLTKPEDYDARAEILWAGSLSHNGLTGCGRLGDWACHQLEHELGGMFDVAHGAGLAAVWGSWARYVYKSDVARFAKFAVNVMGIPYDYANPEKTALEGIEALENFFRSIHMPVCISELGVELNDDQIKELAHKCSFMDTRTIGGIQKLDKKDIAEIYRMAK